MTKILNEALVVEIKNQLLFGHTGESIASRFGVTKSTIYAIKQGRSWSHVSPTISEKHAERILRVLTWLE